jgi:hypothetical protein
MEENRIPKEVLYMKLETTRLRNRPRNRWHDEVRGNGSGWTERVYDRGMDEEPENGQESSHSAHASGMNELINLTLILLTWRIW